MTFQPGSLPPAGKALLEAAPWHVLDVARALLLAHSALETGHWKKMPGNNYGGIKATKSWKGKAVSFVTQEVLGGRALFLTQNFRAYDTLEDGAKDFVALLQTRYAKAWVALEHGDAILYASLLKQAYYYTASEAAYARLLRLLQTQYLSRGRSEGWL